MIVRRAILICLTLTACLPPPGPYQGTGTSVIIIGDSQTYQAQNGFDISKRNTYLSTQIAASGRSVSVSAAIGASTTSLVVGDPGTYFQYPSTPPDVLVVALGTNDMHAESPQADVESRLLEMLDNIPADCLVLVEIPETAPWGLDVTGPAWNAFLHTVADVVVEWADAVAADPSLAQSDGVHQTLAGAVAFRDAIDAAIAKCEAPRL